MAGRLCAPRRSILGGELTNTSSMGWDFVDLPRIVVVERQRPNPSTRKDERDGQLCQGAQRVFTQQPAVAVESSKIRSPKNLDDAFHVRCCGAPRLGIEQAERDTPDLLTSAFQALAEAPKSAPACDHIRAGYRRRNVERHMIYFRLTDYGNAIIRILHERMDAPHRL